MNFNDPLERSSSGATYLHCSVAGTHHTCTRSMHLRQVIESQDVASLRGQVEEFECLFVITFHTNAI